MKIYDYKGSKNICGPVIKTKRKEFKITQEELAGLLVERGVMIERDSVSRMEIGTRFIADYELRAIADIFSCTIRELFPADNMAQPEKNDKNESGVDETD